MKSHIVELIKSDKNWRQRLNNLGIRIKFDEEFRLAIFNYGIDVDNNNPIVREARGIIIDLGSHDNPKVVCWPFSRFFNSFEEYADPIDWNNCRVEEKIDGSIVKLWWLDKWRWSTNSCIDAFDATVGDDKINFLDIIKSAVNYRDIPFDNLDKKYTYIFELVGPTNQVVIKYPVIKLYHIGTRNNITGEEVRLSIGVEQPKIYDIHTLDDCIEAAKSLNNNSDQVKNEGFVVVDNNWHRVKVKSPEYLELHHAINNGNYPKDKIIGMIMNDSDELRFDIFPLKLYVKYYTYKLTELEYNISRYIDYARGLYEEYNHDRRAVANTIRYHKLAAFGFSAIGNDKTASQLIMDTKLSTICKLIPNYVKEDIYR